jgi:hypothetical protein
MLMPCSNSLINKQLFICFSVLNDGRFVKSFAPTKTQIAKLLRQAS